MVIVTIVTIRTMATTESDDKSQIRIMRTNQLVTITYL